MVIYGPTNKAYDIDVGPVMLSDWYRNDYMTNIRGLMRPVSQGGPINPLTNSNLINGKMRFPCENNSIMYNCRLQCVQIHLGQEPSSTTDQHWLQCCTEVRH